MKISVLCLSIIASSFIVLGCTSKSILLSDGVSNKTYMVKCGALFQSVNDCRAAASELCPAGYDVIETHNASGSDYIASMTVKCH